MPLNRLVRSIFHQLLGPPGHTVWNAKRPPRLTHWRHASNQFSHVECLEDRSYLSASFQAGQFEQPLNLLYDESGSANIALFPSYVAPVGTGSYLSLSISSNGDFDALATFNLGNFSQGSGSLTFSNGEALQPGIDARPLAGVYTALNKSLLDLTDGAGKYGSDPIGGVMLSGSLTVRAVYHEAGSSQDTIRTDTFLVHRFISAADEGTNHLPLGLTLAGTESHAVIYKSLQSRFDLSTSSANFEVDYDDIKYLPPAASLPADHLRLDAGTISVFGGTGQSRREIGNLVVDGQRYVKQTVFLSETELAQAIADQYPSPLRDPVQMAHDALAGAKQLLTQTIGHASGIPLDWATTRSDANIRFSFVDGTTTTSEVATTILAVPDAFLQNIQQLTSTVGVWPEEKTRYELLREIVRLHQANAGKPIETRFFVNKFAKYTDVFESDQQIAALLAKTIAHEIGHAIGFTGHTTIGTNSDFDHDPVPYYAYLRDYDVMSSGIAKDLPFSTIMSYEFQPLSSLPFLFALTGRGQRPLTALTGSLLTFPIRDRVPTAATAALKVINKDYITPQSYQWWPYHNLEVPGQVSGINDPDIDIEGFEDGFIPDINLAGGPGDLGQSQAPNGPVVSKTFRIRNLGAQADLVIARIDAAEWLYVLPGYPTRLGPGEEGTFTVQMLSRMGSFHESSYGISVYSNDPDENPFDMYLYGTQSNQVDISGFTLPVNYKANSEPVALSNNAYMWNANYRNLKTGKLTVTLTGNAESTDLLSIRNQGSGPAQIGVDGTNVTYAGKVIGSFTGTTSLTITFNKDAFPVAVDALLNNLTFSSTVHNPSTLPRTAQLSLTDDDGSTSTLPTVTINVGAGSGGTSTVAPLISSFDSPVTYLPGSAPVLLDNDATVTGITGSSLNGAKLTVSLTANSEKTDRLAIRGQATTSGVIAVAGSTVKFNGLKVGTVKGTTTLTVTFNKSATPAAVEAILRSITFSNTSSKPSTLQRTARVTLTIGKNKSNQPTKSIQVSAAF